jgi:hypothetical protein
MRTTLAPVDDDRCGISKGDGCDHGFAQVDTRSVGRKEDDEATVGDLLRHGRRVGHDGNGRHVSDVRRIRDIGDVSNVRRVRDFNCIDIRDFGRVGDLKCVRDFRRVGIGHIRHSVSNRH